MIDLLFIITYINCENQLCSVTNSLSPVSVITRHYIHYFVQLITQNLSLNNELWLIYVSVKSCPVA